MLFLFLNSCIVERNPVDILKSKDLWIIQQLPANNKVNTKTGEVVENDIKLIKQDSCKQDKPGIEAVKMFAKSPLVKLKQSRLHLASTVSMAKRFGSNLIANRSYKASYSATKHINVFFIFAIVFIAITVILILYIILSSSFISFGLAAGLFAISLISLLISLVLFVLGLVFS